MLTLFKKRFKQCHSLAYDMETENLSTELLYSSRGAGGQSRMNLGSHKCFSNPH